MIPYEELVAALARWRARQGLPTGLGDYLGEAQPASFDHTPLPERDYSQDEEVEIGDDLLDGVVEEPAPQAGYGDGPGYGERAVPDEQPYRLDQPDEIDEQMEVVGLDEPIPPEVQTEAPPEVQTTTPTAADPIAPEPEPKGKRGRRGRSRRK